MNPSILVLDEPSTRLDPRAQGVNQFTARNADHTHDVRLVQKLLSAHDYDG